MWPIVLGQLNLPRRIRYSFANLILTGIIPGQREGKEPKHIDPYLEVLVEEIILSGSTINGAYRKAPFQAKVEIMIYILDYQGFGNVFWFNWHWLLPKLWMVHAEGSLLQALA